MSSRIPALKFGSAVAVLASPSAFTQTSNSIPPSEFTRFTDLPTELRLKIWRYASRPRLVIWGYGGANQKLPAVCQTNHEAREETRARYQFYERPPGHIKGKEYRLLVDMGKDVLYRRCALPRKKAALEGEGNPTLPPCKATDWMQNIRHLAINLDDAVSDGDLWANLTSMCPRLKELIIVCGSSRSMEMSWTALSKLQLARK